MDPVEAGRAVNGERSVRGHWRRYSAIFYQWAEECGARIRDLRETPTLYAARSTGRAGCCVKPEGAMLAHKKMLARSSHE